MDEDIKRITIVGPLPPPAGGMAIQTKKLAQLLTDEKLFVDIVQVNSHYKPAWVKDIPILRAFFRLFFYMIALNRSLKKCDLVHIMANSGWSWHLFVAPAIIIASYYKKPIIVNYRGGNARKFFNKSWFWVNLTLKKVQKITVPSSYLQGVFSDFGKEALIVPNVLDEHLFNTQNRPTDEQSPHIIITRNLEEIYDINTAIKSFAIVQKKFTKARLSIAGTGTEKKRLIALISELDISEYVTFTGQMSPQNIASLYKSADVMLNSSTVDNSPNSIIESLACGTPVVTTNVGGIPNLVTHDVDALMVNVNDSDKMAEYTLLLLNNDEKRQALISNGIHNITKFHWVNVWTILKPCYESVMKNNMSVGEL